MMNELVRNPYRQPKPKRRDVVFSETVVFPDADSGPFRLHSQSFRIHLTSSFLWLGEQLTIPLPCVLGVERADAGGGCVQVRFWHELKNCEQLVFIRPTRLLKGSNKLIEELGLQIAHHVSLAPQLREYFNTNASRRVYVRFSCEECAVVPAALYASVYSVSFGIPVVAYLAREYGDERLLCEKHAAHLCMQRCALTGLVGFWSIIGPFTASRCIWRNAESLVHAFPQQANARVLALIPGFAMPVLVLGSLLLLAILLV